MLERIDIFNVCNLYSWLQYDSHTTPRPRLHRSRAVASRFELRRDSARWRLSAC